MDKELLKQILTNNNRVVIPNFGAFLRKQQGEGLVFSPFLKSDDGVVAGVVAKEYGVSLDEAQVMVSEFVNHIRGVLSSKSKYYIDDLGMLIVDSNGAISFVAESPRVVQPTPAPMPTPMPTPQRIMPQPIVQHTVAPQPIAPQPVVAQPIMQQPIPQPIAQPIPQPIAQPRQGVAAPQPMAGPFARPAAPSPIPNIPSAIGQPEKQHAAPSPAQMQTPVARPQVMQQGQGQNPRRKPQPNRQKGSKNDIWLIGAIVAALIVVVIMVIVLITSSNAEQLHIQ